MKETNTMNNTKKVVAEARKAGTKVIHVTISFAPGHGTISGEYGVLAGVKEGAAFEAGNWGAEICDDTTPQEGGIVIGGKKGLCGFASTNLDIVLRQNNIKVRLDKERSDDVKLPSQATKTARNHTSVQDAPPS